MDLHILPVLEVKLVFLEFEILRIDSRFLQNVDRVVIIQNIVTSTFESVQDGNFQFLLGNFILLVPLDGFLPRNIIRLLLKLDQGANDLVYKTLLCDGEINQSDFDAEFGGVMGVGELRGHIKFEVWMIRQVGIAPLDFLLASVYRNFLL